MADCPQSFVKPETWTVIELASLYEKGLPPVAGGVLDQCQSFVDAARFAWAEEARNKAELHLK